MVAVAVGDRVGEAVRAREAGERGIGEGTVAIDGNRAAAGADGVEGGDGGRSVALIVVGEHVAGGDGGVDRRSRVSPTASGARSMAIVATAGLESAMPSFTVTLIAGRWDRGFSLVLLKKTCRSAVW